jgi:hypothetical protein
MVPAGVSEKGLLGGEKAVGTEKESFSDHSNSV